MALRGIEKITKIHHTTVIRWIKEARIKLPDVPAKDRIPYSRSFEINSHRRKNSSNR